MTNFIKNIFNNEKKYTEPQLLKEIDKIIKKKGDINALIDGKLSLLHIAVAGNHIGAVKKLIEVKADMNIISPMGIFPLHSACLGPGDSLDMIKILTENGANAQAETEKDEKPLHFASYFKDSKTGEYLAQYYDDIDIKDIENETPLHKAAYWGNRGMTELLIKKGADINAQSMDGMTPLHLTIFFLRLEAMDDLLKGGADPNIKNNDGHTPLFILTSYILPDDEVSKKKMLDMLLSSGAEFTMPTGVDNIIDLGIEKFERGDCEGAIKLYNEALIMEPDNVYALFNRGNAFTNSENRREAVKDYTRTIELDPRYIPSYLYRGDNYVHLEMYEEALNDFNKVIEMEPEGNEGYFRRGVFYFSMQKTDEARKDFIKAAKMGNERAGELLKKHF